MIRLLRFFYSTPLGWNWSSLLICGKGMTLKHATLTTLILFLTSSALAQLETVTPKKPLVASENLQEGWHPSLKFGGNFSLGSNSHVVGQTDGDTITLGSTIEGGLIYKKALREWRNKLNWLETISRNPTIDRYVKTNDNLKIESIYLRGLEKYPRIGPFVKLSAETAVFKGEDVREKEVTYQIRRRNQSIDTVTANSLRLTDGFRPLTTKESVGFFAKIVDREKVKLEARLGIGAMQIAADRQLAVKDDGKTADIEVEELKSIDQVGTEAGLELAGQFDEKSSYSLTTEFLTPLSRGSDKVRDKNNFERTNIDITGRLQSKIYDWASLSYELKIKRQPELIDEYQVQHFLLLNFSYSLM